MIQLRGDSRSVASECVRSRGAASISWRLATLVVAAAGLLAVAPRGAEAQQTLTRNALSAANNTLGNLSGWSTAATASGVTPTSITASDTLSFTNWWTPGKLSSARLWFDAADIGTVTLSGSDVTAWANKVPASADNGNVTQMTNGRANPAEKIPTYVTTGSQTLNGLPSLSFDGAGDGDRLRTNGTFTTQGWTGMNMVTVNKGATATSAVRYVLGYTGSQGSILEVSSAGSVRYIGRPVNSTFVGTNAGPVTVSSPAVSGISFLGASSANNAVSYANGVAGAAANSGGSTMQAPNAQWLEMGLYSGGSYQQISGEYVVTNSSSTTERQLLEGYMAWKWGTQSLLANDHPYKNAPPVSTTETYYTGGNQSAAGLNFGAAGSATTLLGGTSATAAANTMTLGSGGITVAAGVGATTLGEASGATVALVVGANQAWTNNSASVLQAHNGISRAAGDTTNRQLTIAGSGETRLDGVIADGGTSGTLGLLKQGAGKLVLGGANTFTGTTSITGGTLAMLAGASLASSEINIGLGGVFDTTAGGFTLDNGTSIGGKGSILGNFVFGEGSSFKFAAGELLQLTLTGGTASFASTFGIANILGIDETTPEGTYTLIDGTVNFANVINVGAGNAVPIGDGSKQAYLQQGSLQLVVVPEPAAVTLAVVGVGLAWAMRRRLSAR